jgi:hypothetical protein
MSLSKCKCWYSNTNNCLHFLKCAVPLRAIRPYSDKINWPEKHSSIQLPTTEKVKTIERYLERQFGKIIEEISEELVGDTTDLSRVARFTEKTKRCVLVCLAISN